MRTTVDIDDRVLAAAREMARHEHVSIGTALSRLAERGLRAGATGESTGHRFPTFAVDAGAPPITLEVVLDHRDD